MTSAKTIGLCAACGRSYSVRCGVLALHGFHRTGQGTLVGKCRGANCPPHELSVEIARTCLLDTRKALERQKKCLVELRDAHTLVIVRRRKGQLVEVPLEKAACGEYVYEKERERQLEGLVVQIRSYKSEIERLDKLVNEWREAPLRTHERRNVRKARSTTSREERYQLGLSRIQARIDKAIRTRNSRTLADIWTRSLYALQAKSSGRMMKQIVADVDRDHIWIAFGLPSVPTIRGIEGRNMRERVALTLMRDRQVRIDGRWTSCRRACEIRGLLATWPSALGAESEAGSKTQVLALRYVRGLLDGKGNR